MPRILLVGLLVGLVSGLLAGGFHNLFTVPVMERAIVLEEERSAALPSAPADEGGAEVSLGVQRIGLVVGNGIYGAVLGIIFAGGYTLLRRTAPNWKPFALAVAVGALGFWALSLFPFIRYPLNPPGVGEAESLTLRQGGQVLFMFLSAAGAAALVLGIREVNDRTQDAVSRYRLYAAGLLVYGGFTALIFLLTPANPDPVPVPIDLLELFRTLTMAGQFLMWALMASGAGLVMMWYQRRENGFTLPRQPAGTSASL